MAVDGLPSVGGDAARFMSDGLELDLENGRSVRPQLRDPDDNGPWMATWVDPESGEVGLGPETDDTRAVLSLAPAKKVYSAGERIWHYEWNGWLWCDREGEAFDWQRGNVECPHCGDEFRVLGPSEPGANGPGDNGDEEGGEG